MSTAGCLFCGRPGTALCPPACPLLHPSSLHPLPCSFDQEVTHDIELVPDGFVYLRANPGTCMQRMRRR